MKRDVLSMSKGSNAETVLITGITGFVGSHLAEYLLTLDGVHVYGTILIVNCEL